jgi:hypothetical protein
MTENNETTNTSNADPKIRRKLSFDGETLTIMEHTGTETEGNVEPIHTERYELSELPENIYVSSEAGRHGIKQKLSDHTANMSEKKGYTTTDRFDAIGELWEQLKNGEWTQRKEGAGTKLSQNQIASKMAELGLSPKQFELAKKMGLIKG